MNRNPAKRWLPGVIAELAISRLVCPRCKVQPGVSCLTKNMVVARETHWARVEPMAMAWQMGGGKR